MICAKAAFRWRGPTCTLNRAGLFHDFASARLVVMHMRLAQERGDLDSLAWVVMPDHVHWLFQLKGQVRLSSVIKSFKGRSAWDVARQLGLAGGVWQRGFHDHCIRNDEDLRAVARYIVANPIRAGLVSRLGEYPHWDAMWL